MRDTTWTDWDYILIEAVQLHDDWTDSESGQWIPHDQSGNVWWDVKRHESGALAAIETEQKKSKDGEKPGVRLYAVPTFEQDDDGNDIKPSLEQYLKEMEEGISGERRPRGQENAAPPTPEQMLELRRMQAENG